MKDVYPYPLSKIGIIGGGQLGKMLTQKAKQMGFHVCVLDPTPESPAGQVADAQLIGDFYDSDKIRALTEQSDVVTYDIEHIDTDILKDLVAAGHEIYPSPYLLDTIQDKFRQKEVLARKGIPVPHYQLLESLELQAMEKFGFPVVQKARWGGYDGRGVVVLREAADIASAIQTESVMEEMIDLEMELAVMVARDHNGHTKCYPVVEMVVDPEGNILDLLLAPARISQKVAAEAQEIAIESVKALDGVGIFGVEMFLSKKGELFLNEIAPRPHNSGHYTIETCVTSQFEQHLRAITRLPLGSTQLLKPVAMINLLGEPGFEGTPLVEGLAKALAMPGVSFHLYGKAETRPMRKMGHVTVVDDDLQEALKRARSIKQFLKIKARKN